MGGDGRGSMGIRLFCNSGLACTEHISVILCCRSVHNCSADETVHGVLVYMLYSRSTILSNRRLSVFTPTARTDSFVFDELEPRIAPVVRASRTSSMLDRSLEQGHRPVIPLSAELDFATARWILLVYVMGRRGYTDVSDRVIVGERLSGTQGWVPAQDVCFRGHMSGTK